MMAQIRLLARRVLKGDAVHRSKGAAQSGERIWTTEGRISKSFGQRLSLGLPVARPGDCNWLKVPVPNRQPRPAKILGNAGHMSQYQFSLV